jgi:hypothetical protein
MKQIIFRSTFLSLLLVFTNEVYSQRTLLNSTIYLSDEANAPWIRPCTDNIGDILIDAYLSGKLRGYRDGVLEKFEYAPVPTASIPAPWKKGQNYWTYDVVSYEGQYFEYIDSETEPAGPPSDQSQWRKFTLLGDVTAQEWAFPGISDTLTKEQLLDRLVVIRENMGMYSNWGPGDNYYQGDYVQYFGNRYQAIRDVTSQTPPPDDKESWIYQPIVYSFVNPGEVNRLQIISLVENGNTQPQMLGLGITDEYGFDKDLIYFYYEEALNYLREIKQILLYTNQYGYVGMRELIMDEHARIALLQDIRALAQKHKLKVGRTDILNEKLYSDFRSDTSRITDLFTWKIMQSLDGNIFLLSAVVEDLYTPFLSLPVASLKKTFAKDKVVFETYESLLQGRKLQSIVDTLYDVPSKGRITAPETKSRIPQGSFFRESYTKVVDSVNNLKLYQLMEQLYNTTKARGTPRINSLSSFFPSKYDWSRQTYHLSVGEFQFAKDFQVGHSADGTALTDTLAKSSPIHEFSVTYEKLPSASAKFQAVEFTLWTEDYARYSFEWQAIRPFLLASDPALVASIENGTVTYDYSDLTYGLIEIRK